MSRGHSDRQFWSALWILFALLAVAMTSYLGFEYQAIEKAERERLARLGNILDKALEARIRAIDGVLKHLSHDPEWQIVARSPPRHAQLQTLSNGMLGARTITILDAQGIVRASNRSELIGVDLSERPYFAAARTAGEPHGLIVSEPFTTKLGAFAINLVHPVANGEGQFTGLVAVTLDPKYFSELLDAFRDHDDIWLAIAHGKGKQLMMVPDRAGMGGKDLNAPGSFFSRHLASGQAASLLSGTAHATGEQRLMAIRTIHPADIAMDHPLVVAISRDLGAIAAPWWQRVYLVGGGYATFVLSSILLMAHYLRKRRLSQIWLDHEREKLRSIIDSLDASVALLDPDGTILQVNRPWSAFGQANGANNSVCLGIGLNYLDSCRQAVKNGDAVAQTILDGLNAVRKGEQPHFHFEYPCHCEGVERWFMLSATPTGFANQIVISHLDISPLKLAVTELMLTQEALKLHQDHLEELVKARTNEVAAAEERLRMIVDSAADGIMELDRSGIIRLVNPAASAMLGYPPAELCGRNVHDAIHDRYPNGDPYPASECAVIAAIGFGRKLRIENDIFWHAQGHAIPVTVATHPIWRDKILVGAVLSFADNTSRQLAETLREEALKTAEARARMKSEFLANMSHEIRTPLNGVLGFAQIGYRDNADHHQAQETFARILDSGNLLLGIINNILDLSKIEAGKLDVESVPLDPAAVVDEAIRTLKTSADAKRLPILSEKSDLPPACLGDPTRILQILLNLMSNALKFTAHGNVRLDACRENEALVFRVTDTGIGISPADQERLFQPFEQLDASTTRQFGGTGLGLTISRRLAELMGGQLSLRSTPGVGSTFTLRLPLRETQEPVRLRRRPMLAHEKRLAGLRVLVAEDNEVNRMVIEDFLTQEGAQPTLVGDGLQAVKAVVHATTPFDVVLMDVQMPVMDGIEATRKIKALFPELTIIGQTAHALQEERDNCLAAGMAGMLTKPILTEDLVGIVRDHVGTHGASSEPPTEPEKLSAAPVLLVVDWQALQRRYPERPTFIERLVALGIKTHAQDALRLRDLIAAGDLPGVERLAHTLKGMAGNLEAQRLLPIATRVVQMARANDPDTLTRANELTEAIEQLLTELQQGCPDASAIAGLT